MRLHNSFAALDVKSKRKNNVLELLSESHVHGRLSSPMILQEATLHEASAISLRQAKHIIRSKPSLPCSFHDVQSAMPYFRDTCHEKPGHVPSAYACSNLESSQVLGFSPRNVFIPQLHTGTCKRTSAYRSSCHNYLLHVLSATTFPFLQIRQISRKHQKTN
jgi:hypothetical protein